METITILNENKFKSLQSILLNWMEESKVDKVIVRADTCLNAIIDVTNVIIDTSEQETDLSELKRYVDELSILKECHKLISAKVSENERLIETYRKQIKSFSFIDE